MRTEFNALFLLNLFSEFKVLLIFKEDYGKGVDRKGLTATEPITVNTSNKNPLQANICFNKLVETVTELFNQQKQRTNADGKLQDKDNGGKIHTKFVYKFLCILSSFF